MGGEHELPIALRGERIPMPRRNRQATLRIETERCCALEHLLPLPHTAATGKTLFSHFGALCPTLEEKKYPVKPNRAVFPFGHKHLRAKTGKTGNPLINQRQ